MKALAVILCLPWRRQGVQSYWAYQLSATMKSTIWFTIAANWSSSVLIKSRSHLACDVQCVCACMSLCESTQRWKLPTPVYGHVPGDIPVDFLYRLHMHKQTVPCLIEKQAITLEPRLPVCPELSAIRTIWKCQAPLLAIQIGKEAITPFSCCHGGPAASDTTLTLWSCVLIRLTGTLHSSIAVKN